MNASTAENKASQVAEKKKRAGPINKAADTADERAAESAATLTDENGQTEDTPSGPRKSALLDLLYSTSAKAILAEPTPDLGLAEQRPFPFMALVGQTEMRVALLLAVINPNVGGVLLIGQRGTGKTTAVRSLTGLLPAVEVSDCDAPISALKVSVS